MQSWRLCRSVILFVALAGVAACSKTPTTPTPPPPPPPPVGNPPTITCGNNISRSTVSANGMSITFDAPATADGQGSVAVTCSPESGNTFPVGKTDVTCTATDTLNRTATCTFSVTVAKIPQLSKTRFLAFGDSITAGEVTFPVGSLRSPGTSTSLTVLPAYSYPTVLAKMLLARYTAQEEIFVANYGLSGEKAITARDRYYSALNAIKPEVVLLMEGYNDVPGGQDGAASGAASEIDIMAAEARRRDMRVYIGTLAPPRPGGFRAIGQIFIDDYNNRMRVVAARQGAVLVDVYAALLPGVNTYIGADGLHPTEAGYAKIADTFYQAIVNTLEVR